MILIGYIGSGKYLIANTLGVNACQSGYKTRYVRLPKLFSELEAARISLMVLDEFLLITSSDQEQRDLMELINGIPVWA